MIERLIIPVAYLIFRNELGIFECFLPFEVYKKWVLVMEKCSVVHAMMIFQVSTYGNQQTSMKRVSSFSDQGVLLCYMFPVWRLKLIMSRMIMTCCCIKCFQYVIPFIIF